MVNSAGLNSAVVSEQLGIPGYVIKPVKGEYFVLDKLAGPVCQDSRLSRPQSGQYV